MCVWQTKLHCRRDTVAALGNKHEMACHYILDLHWLFVGIFHSLTELKSYGCCLWNFSSTKTILGTIERQGMPAEALSLV
jgi:hypothetical protein